MDCKHDDYFHTNPSSANYLASHWNVANSAYLGKHTGRILLDRESAKYNGWVTATLSQFSPGKRIYLKWDGVDLTSVVTDGNGRATIQFRAPLDVFGTHLVTGRDGNGLTGEATLRIIPRILLNVTSGPAGTQIRVYYYGFASGEKVDVQWYTTSTKIKVLTTVTIASNGRGSVLIRVPSDASTGNHKVAGKVRNVSRSASDTFRVTGPSQSDEETATPTPTPSPTTTVIETPIGHSHASSNRYTYADTIANRRRNGHPGANTRAGHPGAHRYTLSRTITN